MQRSLRSPGLWWLFLAASAAACWVLAIGWRTPELVAIHHAQAALEPPSGQALDSVQAAAQGPPGPATALPIATHLIARAGSLPALPTRALALLLLALGAALTGRVLRAATGYGPAPSLAPLTAILVLASPLAAHLLLDVRALPLLVTFALVLAALLLALAPPDDDRRTAKLILANVALALGLAPLDLALAGVVGLIVLLTLLVPHRDRHPIAPLRTPFIGLALGLLAAHTWGSTPPPPSIASAWTVLFVLVFTGAVGMLFIGFLAQPRYRQSILTLLVASAICMGAAALSPGLEILALALVLFAIGLTLNAQQARFEAIAVFSALLGIFGSIHFFYAQEAWSLDVKQRHTLDLVRTVVAERSAADPNSDVVLLVEDGFHEPHNPPLHAAPLGKLYPLSRELLHALDPSTLPTLGTVAPKLVTDVSDPNAHVASPTGLRVFARFGRYLKLPPAGVDPSGAPRTTHFVQADFHGTELVVTQARTLAGLSRPLDQVTYTRTPSGGLRFDQPIPAHLVPGVSVRFMPGAFQGYLVAEFGDPLSADHRTQHLALKLPAGAVAPNPEQPFEVHFRLARHAEALSGPPLTAIEVRPSATQPERIELLDVTIEAHAPVAQFMRPQPGDRWDLRAGAAPPTLRAVLTAGNVPLERFELDLEIATGPDAAAKTWQLQLSGSLLADANGVVRLMPQTFGPSDPKLASARSTWSGFLANGLALALAEASPQGTDLGAHVQARIYGPGDLWLAETPRIPIQIRTDTE